jgi:fermentation-respiration switch protein FrsA (DUF1100 family)
MSRRFTWQRALVTLVALAVVAYAGAIVFLITHETELVFGTRAALPEQRPSSPFEQIDQVPVNGGIVPRAWLLPAATGGVSAPWVLFLHGNGVKISSRLNVGHYERLRALGLNVMAPEYRGFAGLPGTPTESGVAEDARHAYEYLRAEKHVDPKRIVIYGWSLGSAVAVTLASQEEVGAVILEGAPASIVAIGQQRYPLFPVRMIIHNPFESIVRVGAIHAPLLFLHSPEDDVIPIAEGRKLFDAARPPKQFVEVIGGHGYAAEKDPAFFPAVESFLRAQHVLP